MTEEEKKNFLEISKRIGYKVGTYCNDEEIEVFEKILKDYKYKNNLIQKQQEKIEKKDKLIKLMAKEICFKEPLKYTAPQKVIAYFEKKTEDYQC